MPDIRVCTIAPGAFDTPLLRKRIGNSDEFV